MRPLRYSINVTLDGCCHHEAGLPPDEESMRYWTAQIERADALLFGRVSYEMMASAWQKPATGTWPDGMDEWQIPFAETIDRAKKYVVSSTLSEADWNAELVQGDLAPAVHRLKQESGEGLWVGGVTLPLALADLGLIDEYEFVVQPVLAGHGPTLLAGLRERIQLELVDRREFRSGAVAVTTLAFKWRGEQTSCGAVPRRARIAREGHPMCTAIRFSDGSGHVYLARNLDWTSGYGERIVITPTGFAAPSPFGAVAGIRYAVIGMGIVEEGTPLYFDCGNAAGLAVAGLNFPGYAQYASTPVDGATNVAAFEFPLWVASQFSSVDDVEAALSDVVIVDRPINEKYPSSLLHWIIGDATRAIVVEYTADGLRVFDDDVDVLANQPGFAWHHENLRNYLNTSPAFPEESALGRARLSPFGSGSYMRGIPGDYYSPSRFVRAAYVNAHYPDKASEEENVSRAFHTLQQVAMVEGAAKMGSGEFEKTIYTGLFSSRTASYYWNSYDDPTIRSVTLADHRPGGAEVIVL